MNPDRPDALQASARPAPPDASTQNEDRSAWAVFLIFLRLGLTAFGGPVAHLAYFRAEFVARRHWLSERSYSDLVALCQFLPGPASSQVGIALGLSRAGYGGALAAWAGFTLPSALVLTLLALGLSRWGAALAPGAWHGLQVVAVAVVAQAVWGMARSLCPDRQRVTLMVTAACIALLQTSAWSQVGMMLAAGLAGWLWLQPGPTAAHEPLPIRVSRRAALLSLTLFGLLLLGLPIATGWWPGQTLELISGFYRAGSLVFGGGHVVLPLLEAQLVPSGGVSGETFLAGYGLTQAMPGPLFTFAAFLGASLQQPSGQGTAGWSGGWLGLLAIFLPSFLLVVGALPFWESLRRSRHAQAALAGINAAVVGLLLAALYQPVWSGAILGPRDFGLALVALLALMFWRLPPWLVVLGCGLAGWLLGLIA